MTQPTELEKKIADAIIASNNEIKFGGQPTLENWIKQKERLILEGLLNELVERRLRLEYLGPSSLSGRDSNQERIE